MQAFTPPCDAGTRARAGRAPGVAVPQSCMQRPLMLRQTPRSVVAAAAAQDGHTPHPACGALVNWVLEASGYVHPALRVVDAAPCGGGRGLVAAEALDEEAVTGMPMLLVPEDLVLSSEVARFGWANHYEPQGAAPLAELDEATQLAVMLAHERMQGGDSFYAPYVQSLPEELPCAWALSDAELDARLAALHSRLGDEGVEAWRREVLRQRRATDTHADGAAARCRSAFPLESSAFRWAFGTVLSRAFSSPRHLSLLPLIDLCNHGAGRDHPEAIAIGGSDKDVCFTVSSLAGGERWQPLAAGDELLIRYFDKPSSKPQHGAPREAAGSDGTAALLQVSEPDALLCFLSHGCVFPELWGS